MTCASFFFFKQKTAYEMRISDWSSDVCSSDLQDPFVDHGLGIAVLSFFEEFEPELLEVARETGGQEPLPLILRLEAVGRALRPVEPQRLAKLGIGFGERSEARRVGKEGVITCGSRGSPYHKKTKIITVI